MASDSNSSSDLGSMVSQWLASEKSGGSSSSGQQDAEVVSADASLSDAQDGYDTEVMSENSTQDDLLPGEDAPGDSQDSQKEAPGKAADGKTKPGTSTKEVITVSDDKGRRKVEVDFGNKDQMKKYVEMAYGARKWQAERDQAIQGKKATETELSQMKQDWSKLEEAYQNGPEALFDLLQGRKGAFQEHIIKQQQRAEFLRNATPQEVQALEERERAELTAKELEKIRKENEDFKKSIEQEREAAELRSVESKINPVFDKYRFAGKLGSADDEHIFDSMLWTTALKNLAPYEEQGLPLTSEIVEKEFRNVAQRIRSRINTQAEKKVSQVVEQKKQEATENVQAKLKSGYRAGGNSANEARNMIQDGNLTGLLKNWGKYGGLFGNKK